MSSLHGLWLQAGRKALAELRSISHHGSERGALLWSFEISKSTPCDPTSPTRPQVLILPNSSTKTGGQIFKPMGPSYIQTTTVHLLSEIIFSSIHSTIYCSLWLNTIPLFLCVLFLLSIHQLIDVSTKSPSWLL